MNKRSAVHLAAACSLVLLPSTPAMGASTDTSGKKERLVCRSEALTGTRMRTRICRTQAEWQDLTERARQQLDDRYERGSRMETPPGFIRPQ